VTPSGGRGIAQARALLGKVLEGDIAGSPELTFGSSPDESGQSQYRDVPIKAELQRELAGLIVEWRRRALRNHEVHRLREFDSEPQPEDARRSQYIDLRENEYLRQALTPLGEGADIPAWTRSDKAVGKPWSFAVSVKLAGDGRARFLGRITKGQQLKGSGRVVAFLEGRRFQGLEESNAIILDPDFDCVVADDYVLVFNALKFESMFAYAKSLSAYANRTIDEIQGYIQSDLLDTLRRQVGASRALLRRVAGRIRVDLRTADPAKIQRAIERCSFNVTVSTDGGRLRLGFANNDPQDLIKLLTDRGVESMITGRGYIAGTLEPVGS
jgi:hypothetical protein